jgi:hypothetical protein
VKVGDLVAVGMPKIKTEFVSIIMAICLPDAHRNGMHLIQVLENGQTKWYPVGYIKVINEARQL